MSTTITTPSFNEYSRKKWKELGSTKFIQPDKNFDFTTYSEEETINSFFGGKPVLKEDNYEVYTDDPILGEKIIEKVTIYKNRYTKIFGDIKVILFTSKDGTFLLQRYLELRKTREKKIYLFLEIEDSYNLHTVMRIKVGSGISNDNTLPLEDLSKFLGEKGVNVSPKQMKNLIQKGSIANKNQFWEWLLKVVKSPISDVFNFFSADTLYKASDFFEKSIAEPIKSIKASEREWNPEVKEGKYEPLLIPKKVWENLKPFYEHQATESPTKNFEQGEKIVGDIFEQLFNRLSTHKKYLIDAIKSVKPYLPRFIYRKFIKVMRTFIGKIADLKTALLQSLPRLKSIIYRSYTVANAFLCGIYNSLVEIIAGIFSLIGVIFKFFAIREEFKNDPSLMGEFLLEYMENFLEAIRSFDIIDFFAQLIAFQAQTTYQLYRWITEKVPNINLEQVFYYYGYITGLVVEFVVSTLLTGGTAGLLKSIESIASFMRNPLQKLAQDITKSLTFAKDTIHQILNAMRFLLKEIKKGSKSLFTKLKRWLDEIFGFGEKVEDFAQSKRKRRWKEKKRLREITKTVSSFVRKLPKRTSVFVINLTEKVPGLQMRIINNLLVAQFKGTTWFKMNPRGILVELNYTKKLPKGRQTIAELKKVKIELESVNKFGRKVKERYVDDVEVTFRKLDDGTEFFGFKPIFKEEKIHDAKFINQTFKRTETGKLTNGKLTYREPPYAEKPLSKSKVKDVVLKEGDEFYIVEYADRDNLQKVPGGWAAEYEVKNIKELREKLQVLKGWKDQDKGTLVVRKYRVREGQQVKAREGFIGDLTTSRATGPKQWEFTEWWNEEFTKVLNEISTKTLK